MDDIKRLAKLVASYINGKYKKTKAYDTTAEVKRIVGDTAYVHIPGGVLETPVKMTIDAKVGDKVQVHVANGGAWLAGNETAPPTDDTKANKAQATAITAGKTATKAKTAAKTAQKTANKIQQHFWTDEDGAHITEVTKEEYESDPTNAGGNLLAQSTGISLRDGEDELASFKNSGITIGKNSEAHTKFTADGLQFYLDENTNPVNLDIEQDRNGYRWGKLIANYNNIRQASITTDADSHTAYVHTGVYTDDPNDIEWASEVQTNARGIRLRVQAQSGISTNAEVALQPKSADPTSADYYNMEYVIGVPVRGTLETPTVSISATTGTLVSATARRFGQVVQLYMQVRKTSSTAAGSNIFEGTLNTTALIPVIPARGASYFGTHSIVGALSAAGEIIIRNASSTAVTIGAGETAGITFTYLVA